MAPPLDNLTDAAGTRTDAYFAGTQDIEDRSGVTAESNGTAATLTYFSPVYVNALLARDRDTNLDGTPDDRYFFTTDANFNTTAVVSAAGMVKERMVYSAYGTVSFVNPTFWVQNPDNADDYSVKRLFQGMLFNADIGWYFSGQSNFARWYSPGLMIWTKGDQGYIDGMDLYAFCAANPINRVDPNGLASWPSSAPATIDAEGIDVASAPRVPGGGKGMAVGMIFTLEPKYYDVIMDPMTTSAGKDKSTYDLDWTEWAEEGWTKTKDTRDNSRETRVAEGTKGACAITQYHEILWQRGIAMREQNVGGTFEASAGGSFAAQLGALSGYVPTHPLLSAAAAVAAQTWGNDLALASHLHESTGPWVYMGTEFRWMTEEGSTKTTPTDANAKSPTRIGDSNAKFNVLGWIDLGGTIGAPATNPTYKTEAEREQLMKKMNIPYYKAP